MTQERRMQARDHRTQGERCIESVADPGHGNATAVTVGSNRVAASSRTHPPPTHQPRVILHCAS